VQSTGFPSSQFINPKPAILTEILGHSISI
jgi:hypothetical protein